MVLVKYLPLLILVAACTEVTYTASCNPGDAICQRNQNAQTLALIGYKEAATELLCEDDDLRSTLGDACSKR